MAKKSSPETVKFKYPNGKVLDSVIMEQDGMKCAVPKVMLETGTPEEKEALKQSVWSRLRDKFRTRTTDGETDSTTTESDSPGGGWSRGSGLGSAFAEAMRMEATRAARYKDYDKMYEEDAELHRALDVTVANVFTSRMGDQESYHTKSENAKIQQLLEDVDGRVQMKVTLPGICHHALYYGDDFEEPVVDEKQSIVRLKWLNPKFTSRNEDEHGQLLADNAFTMRPDGNLEIKFPAWQVIHLRHQHHRGNLYGTSFYAASRKPWRQTALGEDAMLLTLLNRPDRMAFLVAAPKGVMREEGKKLLEEAKTELKKRSLVDGATGTLDLRRSPLSDVEDIFMLTNKDNPSDIRSLPGSNVSGMIPIIEHFQNKKIMGTGVPPEYLGINRDPSSRATISWKDLEFCRILRSIQAELAWFQRQVYDLQFSLLNMKNVPDKAYEVIYPPISFVDEEMKQSVEQMKWAIAVQAKQSLNIPTEWLLANVIKLPDDDVKSVMKSIEKAQKENPQPAFPQQGQGGFNPFGGQQGPVEWTKEQHWKDVRLTRQIEELRSMLQHIRKHKLNEPLVA